MSNFRFVCRRFACRRYLRRALRFSTLAQRCDASADSAARRENQRPDETNHPTNDTSRNTELEYGKPSSRCVGEKANNEPNEPPDYARRGRSDGHPPCDQRHATQFDRDRVHSPIGAIGRRSVNERVWVNPRRARQARTGHAEGLRPANLIAPPPGWRNGVAARWRRICRLSCCARRATR